MKNYTDEQLKKIGKSSMYLCPGCLVGIPYGIDYQVIDSWETLFSNEQVQMVMEEAEAKLASCDYADEDVYLEALGEAVDVIWEDKEVPWYGADDFPDGELYGIDPRIFEQEGDGAWVSDGAWHENPDGSQVVFCDGYNGTYIAPFVETDVLVAYEPKEDWEPDIHPAAYAVIKRSR